MVIGAGLSGLTTAYTLMRADPELDVLLLEAGAAPGGQVGSERVDGYLFERGPQGFHGGVQQTGALLEELGLAQRVRPAQPVADRHYVYWDGGLRPLPRSTGGLLRSELLSPPGRLRALSEPLLARPLQREETVHDFIARHFGFEAARVFGDLLVAGVCGGDPRELSLDALFPRLRRLELAQGGSLLRGLAAERGGGRQARGPAGALPEGFLGFDDGMGVWVEALAAALGARLRLNSRVVALEQGASSDAPAVLLQSGERLTPDILVLALPAEQMAALLAPTAPTAAHALGGVRLASLTLISLGFDRIDVPRALDAAGVLLPRGQGVRVLELQWSSALFPDRAPKGKALLRVLAGGTRDPGFADLSDEDAVAAVRRDLEKVMGIVAEPEALRVTRWRSAVPQYTVGHAARVDTVRQALAGRWPGVAVVGNYLSGLGVHDVVREARQVEELVRQGQTRD